MGDKTTTTSANSSGSISCRTSVDRQADLSSTGEAGFIRCRRKVELASNDGHSEVTGEYEGGGGGGGCMASRAAYRIGERRR